MHLAIDGYPTDPRVLEDQELLYEFLDSYPSSLGMTKVTEPQVLEYHGPVPEDWGLSGFVIIAESHISVHTFPARNYINVDIFSCKGFDAKKAERDVESYFSLEKTNAWTLERGLDALEARDRPRLPA